MLTKFRTIAASAVIAAAATSASAAEYNFAGVYSLTGAAAFIGVSVKDGMVLAVEEINAKELAGKGNKINLTVADDAGDRQQALSLVGRYAADSNVIAMLGPTTGASSPTAASGANERQLTMIAVSNSPSILTAGPWSFVTTQLAKDTIPYIAGYMVDTAKVKSCGMIGIIDNENYVALQNMVESNLKAKGLNLLFKEDIKTADTDFAAVSTKVASRKDVDCLFISAPGPQAANAITQLRNAGLDSKVKIFGHNSLSSPQFVEVGGKAVEGVTLMGEFLPGGATPEGKAFVEAFKKKYNREPDSWNAFGYAKMYVVLDALKRAGDKPTRASLRDAFAATKDVPVIIGAGKYSLNDKREPQFGMVVMQIKDGKFIEAPK